MNNLFSYENTIKIMENLENPFSRGYMEMLFGSDIVACFEEIKQLHEAGEEFPVSFDRVCPFAFSSKGNAFKRLKLRYQDIDYQILYKNVGGRLDGYYRGHYFLSLDCFEHLIDGFEIREAYRMIIQNK